MDLYDHKLGRFLKVDRAVVYWLWVGEDTDLFCLSDMNLCGEGRLWSQKANSKSKMTPIVRCTHKNRVDVDESPSTDYKEYVTMEKFMYKD